MNRRQFAKTLAILPFVNKKTNLYTNRSSLLSDFATLLPRAKYLIFCENSLKNQFTKALHTSWAGFRSFGSTYYLSENKALFPVIANHTPDCTEVGIVCFERVANQWVAVQSLNALHIEGFLLCQDALPTIKPLDCLLPRQLPLKDAYSYATNQGSVYLKASYGASGLVADMVITTHEGLKVERTFNASLFNNALS